MQIVIEIPNEYRELFEKEKCKEKFDSLCTNEFGYVLRKAFENGTPLPKGHGKLKDVDRLASHDEYVGQGFTESVYKDDIDDLPTIIEADTEGE